MAEAERGRIIIRDKALKGFVQMPIVLVLDREMSGSAKVVYGLLLWYEWRGIGFPGQEAMAEHLGRSVRSVRNDLKELIDAGYLTVEQHGLGRPNTYIIESLQDRPEPIFPDRQDLAGLGGKILPVQAARSCRSLELQDSKIQDSLSQTPDSLADTFLQAIGEPKPAKKRRERVIQVINALTAEGFTPEAIGEACRLARERGARGPELLPYLVGEAAERVEHRNKTRRRQAELAETERQDEQVAEERYHEGMVLLEGLTPKERADLEAEARLALHLDDERHNGPATQAVVAGWIIAHLRGEMRRE